MKLYHDCAINLSRKSREINCLTVSGYYPVNRLVKLQINIRIYPLSVKIIDIRSNPTWNWWRAAVSGLVADLLNFLYTEVSTVF